MAWIFPIYFYQVLLTGLLNYGVQNPIVAHYIHLHLLMTIVWMLNGRFLCNIQLILLFVMDNGG